MKIRVSVVSALLVVSACTVNPPLEQPAYSGRSENP